MKKLLSVAFLTMLIAIDLSGQNGPGCPTVEVVGPAGVTAAGEGMFFRANVSGRNADKITSFKWTISTGTITDGQGTDQIRVDTTPELSGANVTATVTINGLHATCRSTASETAPIMQIIEGCPIDHYGEAVWEDEQARLDNLLTQLTNNPKSHAFIEMAVLPRETIEKTKKHISKISRHIRSRDAHFDLGRLRFAVTKAEEHISTRFWIIPDGATGPECAEGCTLINAKHLYF